MNRCLRIALLGLMAVVGLQVQTSVAQGGPSISLPELQALAKAYYPLLKQKDIYAEMVENKVKQINANYLPQLTVTGQATYQSEVTKIAIPLPDAQPFQQKPDQYSFGLEVRQNLFDFGAIRTQKELERGNSDVQVQQLDVEYGKVKERINQLFGNICLQQENLKIQELRIEELEAKGKKVQSAVANGAALQSSWLVLESERLTTLQRMEEIRSNLDTWYKTLSLLTGKEIDGKYTFTGLEDNVQLLSTNTRPELRLFDLQSSNLVTRESLLRRMNMPRLFVFARGYVGRPGFNFLNNDFRPYGLAGIGVSWNLSAFYTQSRELKGLHFNQDLIQAQRKLFDLNLQATLVQYDEEVQKLERLISLDRQIMDAKTAIRKTSSSQLDNGAITSSDYIVDLNGENQAQFNLKLHQIQLLMAKQNYNTALGY